MLSCGFTFASARAARTPANTGNPTLIYRKTPLEDPSVDRGFYAVIGWGDGWGEFLQSEFRLLWWYNISNSCWKDAIAQLCLHLDVQVNTNLDILQFLLSSVDNLVKYHQIVKKTHSRWLMFAWFWTEVLSIGFVGDEILIFETWKKKSEVSI